MGWATLFDYCALLYYTCTSTVLLYWIAVSVPYEVLYSLLTTCGWPKLIVYITPTPVCTALHHCVLASYTRPLPFTALDVIKITSTWKGGSGHSGTVFWPISECEYDQSDFGSHMTIDYSIPHTYLDRTVDRPSNTGRMWRLYYFRRWAIPFLRPQAHPTHFSCISR